MGAGIPIRLSKPLADSARQSAAVMDRSITEQVEHWARLGRAVEAVVLGTTIERLKLVSHDERLAHLMASADTSRGRRKAAQAIRQSPGPRYGVAAGDPDVIVRFDPDGTTVRGRMVGGRFVAGRSAG